MPRAIKRLDKKGEDIMIGDSSNFRTLVSKYIKDADTVSKMVEYIKRSESKYKTRTSLQKIKLEFYSESLNTSIEYIDTINIILGYVEQIKINILNKLNLDKNGYDNYEMLFRQSLETLESLSQMGKVEREKEKKQKIKDEMLTRKQNLEETELDLLKINTFLNDLERTRELLYAYYQAVKNFVK